MADLSSWWEALDDDTKQALLLSGANIGQTYFTGRQEDAREEDRRRDSAITNKAEGIQYGIGNQARDYEFDQTQDSNAAVQAGRMAGNSPLQFQRDRAQFSAFGDMLGGAGRHSFTGMPSRFQKHMPTGLSMTPFSSNTMGFFTPGAMAAAEQPYWAAQQNIDPRLKSPDLSSVGYGGAGTAITNNLEMERADRNATRDAEKEAYKQQAAAQQAALMAALNELDPDAENGSSENEDQNDDDGGVDWKKWAGIGAGVGAGYLLGR